MALTPQNNAAFVREVDEELRREQAIAVWRRYGLVAIVVIVAGLLALAGWLFWQHRQTQAAEAQTEALQGAYDQLGANKAPDAAKALADLAASDIGGYRALARFTQADILLQKNDLRGAAARFAAIAADEDLGQPFRDLALLRQTSAEFDTVKPEVVVQRLRGLAVAGNPWFGSAGELVAAAYLKQGRRDLAGQLLGKVAQDKDVPESIRQRAVQLAGVLGVDAVGGNVGGAR